VTVQTSQASVQRGQTATYAVTIATQGGSASNVTVTLTSQPSSQKPKFTSGCAKGNGAATCTISSVADKQSVNLQAQIPVAANASSVSSVKLTATATVATKTAWTPPAAAEAVAVTAASSPSASASGSGSGSHSSSPPPSSSTVGTTPIDLGLGPQPSDNGVSSSLIGAGNAAGLFPDIQPSPTPSPATGLQVNGDPRNNASPVSTSALTLGTKVLPAQVAGLIALAVALLLTMTRLSRRRPSPAGPKDAKAAKDAAKEPKD
jgi:hypothetical protein